MPSVPELIARKRDGDHLSAEEIERLVLGYTRDQVPDYQMAALLMAIYFQGLSPGETHAFTWAMVHSGQTLDLSGLPGFPVDKHSSGGVGDTTTLVLLPLAAAAGVLVPKMSGRGLGHTGGTIDKLESIPGFRADLEPQELLQAVREVGAAVCAQSEAFVPADGKIYALRDVTATVDSLPLIASSIMSKKLAAGCPAILLDVKCGRGALLPHEDRARELARWMVDIGTQAGRAVVAYVTDMNQPLGPAVGNALELRAALDILEGGGDPRLRELCLLLGAEMLHLAGIENDREQGRQRLEGLLAGGQAREALGRLVRRQGGNVGVLDDPGRLPRASQVGELFSPASGFLQEADALLLGRVAGELGAGRYRQGQSVDHGVGLELLARPGDRVEAGQPLARVWARSPSALERARERLGPAFPVGAETPCPPPLVRARIDAWPGRNGYI